MRQTKDEMPSLNITCFMPIYYLGNREKWEGGGDARSLMQVYPQAAETRDEKDKGSEVAGSGRCGEKAISSYPASEGLSDHRLD